MSDLLLSVLVVSGGSFPGLTVVKCLRESSRIRVVLVDCFEDNIGRSFADVFHLVPEISRGEEFLATVQEICAREGVGLVLPSSDHELALLAQHRERFQERGVRVGVGAPGFVGLARDKRALYAALAGAGLPVLPVVDIRGTSVPWPVLGKPVSGWGSRGQVRLHGADDLREHVVDRLAATHVFQPLLASFEELSVDFAIDFGGRVSPLGARRRVRTTGGFAVISETASDRRVAALARDVALFAQARGALGLLNVQLLVHDGRIVVSDINPRLGTSAVHWCGTGFNPVLFLCASVAPAIDPGGPPAPPPRRTVRYLEEMTVPPEGRLEGIRGVVFDLDDTLLHHKRWILGNLEALAAARAEELPEREAFLARATGLLEQGGQARLFDELAAVFGWDEGKKRRLIEAYREVAPPTGALFPDVLPTLETLRRAGFRLGLLADNPPPSQKKKMAACGLTDFFAAVVYSRESGAEKPDRRGFAEVASLLGFPPPQLAMVGDNPHRDAVGAEEAGYGAAFVVRRPGTFYNFDPLLFRLRPGSPTRLRVIEGVRGLLHHLG